MTSKLTDALRQRFNSPEEALAKLGIDPAILDEGRENTMTTSFTRDRGYRSARKLGRDEEEDGRREIREMLDEGAPADEIVAALVAGCPDDERADLHSALSEIATDIRAGNSYRAHARDRLERRRLSRDQRRRLGRDDPEPFPGRPNTGGSMDPIEGEDRRRRMGTDSMAFDRSSEAEFYRRFPNAPRVTRF